MRRGSVVGAVGLLAGAQLLAAAPARATSCGPVDVRAWVEEGNAAVVGTVVGRRGTLDVEVLLGGSAAGGLRVVSDDAFGGGGTAPWRVGDEVALAGSLTEPGVLTVGPCGTLTPAEVRDVAEPVPAPDGSGPAAFLATTDLRGGELALLDARGRLLGWAGAPDARVVAVCPGGERVVTTSAAAWGGVFWERTLQVRDVDDLGVVWTTAPGPYGQSVCQDPAGDEVLSVRLDPNGQNSVLVHAGGESLVAEGVDGLPEAPVEGAQIRAGASDGSGVGGGVLVVDGAEPTATTYAVTGVVAVRGAGPVAPALTRPPQLAAEVWRPPAAAESAPAAGRWWPVAVGGPALVLLVAVVLLLRRRGERS